MSFARTAVSRSAPPDLEPAAHDEPLIEGLRQRATLFERILDDLLGEQAILRHALLPRGLLAPFAAVLRFRPRGRPPWLRDYAVKLARCADGEWRVVSDRVEHAGTHPACRLCEAPALAGFLPRLSRALLGESLRLGAVPSLWLADPGALEAIAANIGRWAIVDAFGRGDEPIPLAGLDPTQRIALQERVDAAPWRFAARLLVAGAAERRLLVRSDRGLWQHSV